jgi:putative addiction module component (TIGR02574 family)
MTLDQIKTEISRLPLSDKLLLVEDTWDSIAESAAALPMPDWQRKELDKRYKEYQEGNVELRDCQSVHESLRGAKRAKS